MSLHEAASAGVKSLSRARIVAVLTVALSAAMLSGCGFQPLYGPTASGSRLNDAMKAVDVVTIPGRVGQRIRNELIYGTTDGGDARAPLYRLEIAVQESLRNLLINKQGDPQGQVVELNAKFKLVRLGDNAVVFDGFSTSSASFDRAGTDGSVFADVRARRDAEDRAARTISDNIKTRLAAYLSGAA